jgi:hypothetical protein
MNTSPFSPSFYFDDETAALPIEQILAVVGPFDPANVKLGNVKDSAKIAEKIEEARVAYEPDLIANAAKYPTLCRLSAVGIIDPMGEFLLLDGFADERKALTDFWSLYEKNPNARFEGWNIFSFDFQVHFIRSLILGVKVPRSLRKISPTGWVSWNRGRDLMVEITGSPSKYLKLDKAARMLGVGAKNGHGEDFAAEFESGDLERRSKAVGYLYNDVFLTKGVGERVDGASPLTETEDVPYETVAMVQV